MAMMYISADKMILETKPLGRLDAFEVMRIIEDEFLGTIAVMGDADSNGKYPVQVWDPKGFYSSERIANRIQRLIN